MADPKAAPIIVVKKKGGHGGHHGGAWKVAYADFVTAMMALFIVLWLMNTSQNVKDSIAGYFKDPNGDGRMVGSAQAGIGDALNLEQKEIEQLKDKLEQLMKETPELAELKDHVQMTVTGEGLRVELLETEKGFFFESGSARPSHNGQEFLAKLAAEVGKMKNKVVIEGHTDAKPFSSDRGYSNWELSTDRANSARGLMENSGLREKQITQVRGFADQHLRNTKDPNDPQNRRISVIIQYLSPTPESNKSLLDKANEKKKTGESGGHDAKPSPVGPPTTPPSHAEPKKH
jgi:chemotaxis protein MotB